jgi:tRNA (guanine37-N1)-methyltransferase
VRISIVTLFPGFFSSPLQVSIVARAMERGLLSVRTVDLRDFGSGMYRQVDDAPFGGGPGMVIMIDPIYRSLQRLNGARTVLLSAAGTPLDQATLDRWATVEHLALLCGRYEGVDQRVADHLVDEEVSLGDFVLAGGEVAALAIVEGVARLLTGVLGNEHSVSSESFRDGLLEEPHYTRPSEYRGWTVPEVLLSGDHARIERWREEQRLQRTRRRRPDLLEGR